MAHAHETASALDAFPLLLATCLVLLAAAPPVLADLRGSALDTLPADGSPVVVQVDAAAVE